MNQTSVAIVVDIEISRFVVVNCPFCGQRHRHYWSLYKPSAPTFIAESNCRTKSLRGYYEVHFPVNGLTKERDHG